MFVYIGPTKNGITGNIENYYGSLQEITPNIVNDVSIKIK